MRSELRESSRPNGGQSSRRSRPSQSRPTCSAQTPVRSLSHSRRSSIKRVIESWRSVVWRHAYGVPAEELALYSASLDLSVVGSRGYGPIGRLVHGSTSQKLARTARCPLLVLPRWTAAAGTSDALENGHEAVSAVTT